MPRTRWGFGVAATIEPVVIRAAAEMAESLGYHSFWVNDTPGGDGLAALAEAATDTAIVKLGIGVIPLSRRSPTDIVARISALNGAQAHGGQAGDVIESQGEPVRITGVNLPLDRLLLGVGSGEGGAGALERVREGVAALRAHLDVPIIISALGPRMSGLAGEIADGVLFNWLTPEYAARSVRWVQDGARRAGRDLPRTYAYVRVSLGEEARARFTREANRYGAVPAYASHFRRMGVAPLGTGIVASEAREVRARLAAWDGVLDEVVVRAITAGDSLEETLALVQAGAPLP